MHSTTSAAHEAYAAAQRADDAFQRELVRAYGSVAKAADARYRRQHADVAVQAARHAYLAAARALHEASQGGRATRNESEVDPTDDQ